MKTKFKLENDIKHVHFIGIGGISMSGLAEILQRDGYIVSGSDWFASDITGHLASKGISFKLGNDAAHISDNIDLIIYTAAVKPDNPELRAAQQKNIPCIDRAKLLGIIMEAYKYSIAVAGVHGKTTTTSIIAEVLLAAKLDPTISIGGFMSSIGSNFRIGNSPYMVLEACEYYDSFLQFHPYVGLILNIDSDHMDYFITFDRMIDSFRRYAQNINAEGTLVIHKNTAQLKEVTKDLACKIITYGGDSCGEGECIWARDIRYDSVGLPSFYIMQGQKELAKASLKLRGNFNIDNALAAVAVALALNIPINQLVDGLARASGTKRRFENKGTYKDIIIIDDYAHHPTEIKASLGAASAGSYKRIICAFQPHTYSRTQNLLEDFAATLTIADIVLILPVYASREVSSEPRPNYLAEMLTKGIKDRGKKAYFADSFASAATWIKENCKTGDLLITMGAGDINLLGEGLISGDL